MKIKLHIVAFLFLVVGQSTAFSQTSWQWAFFPITSAGDTNTATVRLSTSPAGNSYFSGAFKGNVTFGSYTLTDLASYPYTYTSNSFLTRYDVNGNLKWAKKFSTGLVGNSIKQQYFEVYDVGTDNSENVFITGFFVSDSVKLGSSTLYTYRPNDFTMHVVKMDSSGNVLWAKAAGGSSTQGNYLFTDASRNVFVIGTNSSKTVTCDSVTLTFTGNKAYSNDFIVKFNESGKIQWLKQLTSKGYPVFQSKACDKFGNIFISGHYTDTLITVGAFTLNNPSPGNRHEFLVKCDNAGNVVWARNTSAYISSYFVTKNISIDELGNVFMAANYKASLTLDTISLVANNGGVNMYVAKYNGVTSKAMWAISTQATTGVIVGNSIVNDMYGNAYVSGGFTCPLGTFGGLSIQRIGSYQNKFISKITPTGNIQWVSTVYGNNCPVTSASAVSGDKFGNVYSIDWLEGTSIVYTPITLQNNTGIAKNVLAKLLVSPTAVDEHSNVEDLFSIYPNPSSGHFTLFLNSPSSRTTIKIFNSIGELIEERNAINPFYHFELKNSDGLYFVQVSDEKNTRTRKLILE